MKEHPDYELKQPIVIKNEEKANVRGEEKTGLDSKRDEFGTELERINALSEPSTLKNLALDDLKKALDDSSQLLSGLKEKNGEIDTTNREYSKDRQGLGDADLLEIGEKKNQTMKNQMLPKKT